MLLEIPVLLFVHVLAVRSVRVCTQPMITFAGIQILLAAGYACVLTIDKCSLALVCPVFMACSVFFVSLFSWLQFAGSSLKQQSKAMGKFDVKTIADFANKQLLW